MQKPSPKKVLLFVLLVAFVIGLATLLYFLSPEELVRRVGLQNAYLIALIISFLAGFSALTSFSMVATLITLAAGGIHPLYLGLISGVGLAAGDVMMFLLGYKGRELVSGKWEKRLKKLSKWFKGKFKKFIPFLIYFYIGFTPLPNDLLIVFLALIKYPLKKLFLPLLLGDFTYPILVTFLASKGIRCLG